MSDQNSGDGPATSKKQSKSDKDATKASRRKFSGSPQRVRPSKLAKPGESRLAIDEALLDPEFIEEFARHWSNADTDTTTKEWPTASLYKAPFQLCAISKFLRHPEMVDDLIAEIQQIDFERKHMDLYEFFQSTDFANLLAPLLVQFHQQLIKNVMPLVAQLTGRTLTKVSTSCSIYNAGDHLLVHDDRLADRVIAYVFYLSPWDGALEWTSSMGGALELFGCNETGEPVYPIVKSLPPKNNQFVFFKVSERSFHQVGEVTTLDYPRITINGWFHGPAADDNVRPDDAYAVQPVQHMLTPSHEDIILGEWITDNYLKPATKNSIQKHVEETSEASLETFLIADYFEFVCQQLETDPDCQWRREGPANKRNYELLQLDAVRGPIRDLVTLLQSSAFFHLLHEFTELDLSGPAAGQPSCTIDICRVSSNSYSMLDDATLKLDSSLDVIMYFRANENNAGVFTYLNPTIEKGEEEEEEDDDDEDDDRDDMDEGKYKKVSGDDGESGDDDEAADEEEEDDDEVPSDGHTEETSVLLSVSPKNNALNLVYRCRRTTKFLNYISKRAMAPDQYSYILMASYRE